ncbi:MAG TPA: hypothetical protein VIN10_02710 [Bacteroidales bacterium]
MRLLRRGFLAVGLPYNDSDNCEPIKEAWQSDWNNEWQSKDYLITMNDKRMTFLLT